MFEAAKIISPSQFSHFDSKQWSKAKKAELHPTPKQYSYLN